MNEHEHTPYEDELAAYMLDALTANEAREFERHLEGCARCQDRARWLQPSVELLPTTVEQMEPPVELRERLMRTVRAEATAPAAPRRRERPSWRTRLGRLLTVPRPAVALGVALIALAAVLGYAIGSDGDGGGGTTTVTADVSVPGAVATLERDGDRGILRVWRLPQRRDRIYQVWLEHDGAVRSAGLFQVNRNGRGAAAIPSRLADADRVMVSLEPPRGSPQPTTEPLLVAEV